jgi:hypothetical protein
MDVPPSSYFPSLPADLSETATDRLQSRTVSSNPPGRPIKASFICLADRSTRSHKSVVALEHFDQVAGLRAR